MSDKHYKIQRKFIPENAMFAYAMTAPIIFQQKKILDEFSDIIMSKKVQAINILVIISRQTNIIYCHRQLVELLNLYKYIKIFKFAFDDNSVM